MEKLVFLLPSGNICQIEHKPGTVYSDNQLQQAIEIMRERRPAEERQKALDTIHYPGPKVISRVLVSVSVFYLEANKNRKYILHIPGQDWKVISAEASKLTPDAYTSSEVKQATEEAAAGYVFGY